MDADQYQNSLEQGEEEDEDEDEDEEEEEDVENSFVQGIDGGHHDHSQSVASPTFAHSAFGRPPISIDPALDGPSESHHTDGSQHHHRHQQNHFVAQSQIPRQVYTDIARSANQFTLHTPAEQLSAAAPARFTSVSPAPAKILPAFTPSDRSLPDRRVTDENLDDAYVAFILYCNPTVPLNCDTTELRKAFRLPPKSDGKTFNVHRLLQLIEKFEEREIKTWTKLAIELGVERTADQSAQKVQQYAVRLKRWMHAMHIDSFFEYILNKPHIYYQQIPHTSSPPVTPDQMRDGVPLEEDLALRALHPETRPKRGRRKTDEKDDSSEKDMPNSKRPQLDTGTPTSADPTSAIVDHFGNSLFPHPHSAVPSSAGADGMQSFLDEAVTPDQWTAATQSVLSGSGGQSATPTGGQQFRWRAFPRESTTTPQNAHPPPSVLTSHEALTPQDEVPTPTSGTPTTTTAPKPRARRRHGPAVSSAWPSGGNPLTGKLRGRPPSNRSVRDGPFSTFPANPTGKGHTIDISPNTVSATPTPTPIIQQAPQQFTFRPQQLHLTVPQRIGGNPITMASPIVPQLNGSSPWKREKSPLSRETAGISLEELERRFSVGLLQAQSDVLVVSLDEAKRIASQVIGGMRKSLHDSGGDSGSGSSRNTEDKISILLGCDGGDGVCRDIKISRIRERSELEELGLEDDVEDDEELNKREDPDPEASDSGNGNGNGNGQRGSRGEGGGGKTATTITTGAEGAVSTAAAAADLLKEKRYEVRWSLDFGGVRGEFSKVLSLGSNIGSGSAGSTSSNPRDDDDDSTRVLKDLDDGLEDYDGIGSGDNGGGNLGGGAVEEELRRKVVELEKSLKAKEREIKGIKDKVLQAVVMS